MSDLDTAAAGAPAAGNEPTGGQAATDQGAKGAAPNPAAMGGSQDGQPSGSKPAPSVYRPDGLPDHFHGQTDQETIDKLHKAVAGYRQKDGKAAELGEVPAEASAYVYTPSEATAPYMKDLGNDPVWKAVQEAAFKHQIPVKQFEGFMGDMLEKLVTHGEIVPPYDPNKEIAMFCSDVPEAERTAVADKRIRENIAYLDGLVAQKALTAEEAKQLSLNVDSGAFNKFMRLMRDQAREPAPALGGDQGQGVSEAELDARIIDPRGRPGTKVYDPAFAEETKRLVKARSA